MRCTREKDVNEISSDEFTKMIIEDEHINTIGYSILGNYKTDKISLGEPNHYIAHIIFHGCEIDEVVLKDITIRYCKFIGITISKLKLINCDIELCEFDNYCNFMSIECYNSKIYHSTINHCTVGNIIAERTIISETGISTSRHRSGIFSRSTIHDSYFANNIKRGAEKLAFMDCNIVNNKLFNSSVSYLYFYKCRVLHNYTSMTVLGHSQSYESDITFNQICPEEGSFIAYKKVINIRKDDLVYLSDGMLPTKYDFDGDAIDFDEYIAVLEIPVDAKRSSGGSDKCRADKAKVLRLEDMDGNEVKDVVGYSIIGINSLIGYQTGYIDKPLPICTYEAGKTIYSDSFDENKFNTCSNGIHFFMSKELAKDFKY